MALYPWRFQADLTKGETDPMVTVFVGAERAKIDETGEPTAETFVEQDVSNPVQVRLTELPALLADPSLIAGARAPKPTKP
jgi:hypothetical protein